MTESRIVTHLMPTWKQGQKQQITNSEFLEFEPAQKGLHNVTFDLSCEDVLGFGPLSGFVVEGAFQVKDSTATSDDAYTNCDNAEKANVVVQQNWFDHLLKQIDIFHYNTNIYPHDTPPYTDAYINTYIYAHMDKFTKKLLCPEPCNPGNATSISGKWNLTGDEWLKYAPSIFCNSTIMFKYVPLFFFPFYQQPNFILDKGYPNCLPMSLLGKLHIRLFFKDSTNCIFEKKDGNNKEYRFKINSIKFVAEKLNINAALYKQVYSKLTPFLGVTRFGYTVQLQDKTFSHKLKIHDVLLPEGLFIVCLDKNVIGGTAKMSSANKLFLDHNIKTINIQFNGLPFTTKTPAIGDVGSYLPDLKTFYDYFQNPPFGVKQDDDYIIYKNITKGCKESQFPHVFINLTMHDNNTRLIPQNESGTIINDPHDLEVVLTFNSPDGAKTDSTYIIFFYYSDVNLLFDYKTTKKFSLYYNKIKMSV